MKKVLSLVSSRGGRVVAGALIVVLAGIGAVNLDHRSTRERADAWVQTHALPATLGELAAYPLDYQQAITHALPPAEKSRLWRVQLQDVLDHETLNNAQRTFIEKTMAMATPESFLPDAPKPEVCPEVAALFTNPDLRDKVTKLGRGAAPVRSFWSTAASIGVHVQDAVNLRAREGKCNCYGLGLCECGLTEACVDDGDGCNWTDNCGCIWEHHCDKECNVTLPPLLRINGGAAKQ